MNTLAIAIIFGLLFPVYNWIANCLLGSQSEGRKEANAEWAHNHVGLSLMGCLMALAIPVAYWILVLKYLVL